MGKGGSETERNVEVETMVQVQLIANIINCLLHVWFGETTTWAVAKADDEQLPKRQ